MALYNTRGGYAVLLGSGISSAAGIPTGWQVVEDLIRRVAAMHGSDAINSAAANPAAWHVAQFGADPSYSSLLDCLAATPTERRSLLRAYFEPTAEERSEGLKAPTRAHRAIASLVAGGFIRVIVTTNFDHLCETALRDKGIAPAVVSTADAVQGMMPLHLAPATIIKVHGDYLDTRIKNTPEELRDYDPAVNQLLDQVLDEYGLIVCGWSARWDDALRAALQRCPTRRFTTFWATHGEPSPEAQALIDHRRAQVIRIESADTFFEKIDESVVSLGEVGRRHPLSTATAVATLKRYLPAAEHRIRLPDLVQDEVTRTIEAARSLIPAPKEQPGARPLEVLPKLEAITETVMALLAVGAYWGDESHRALWVASLERLGNAGFENAVRAGTHYPAWDNLYLYPAQLAFYASGLAAVCAGKRAEEVLADLLLVPRLRTNSRGEVRSPVMALNVYAVVDHDIAKNLPGRANAFTPFSDYLFEVLRNAYGQVAPDEHLYAYHFDRFEYLVALAYGDICRHSSLAFSAPVGRLAWRLEAYPPTPVLEDLSAEIDREGTNWLLLRRGLFDRSPATLAEVRGKVGEILRRRGLG